MEQEYDQAGDFAPEVLLDVMNPRFGRLHFALPEGKVLAFQWDVIKNDFQSYEIARS